MPGTGQGDCRKSARTNSGRAHYRFSARRRHLSADLAPYEGIAALGLDTAVNPVWANAAVPKTIALQGNLDPIALMAGGPGLDEGIDRILKGLAGRPHIFNLGAWYLAAYADCPCRTSHEARARAGLTGK